MKHHPTEIPEFPGFYAIPGYSSYGIMKNGSVLNLETQTYLVASRNPDGYYNYRITGDDSRCLTWGRHRLLCYVFKHPGCDISNLIVNHINTIKGDDALDNLEWLSYQGNAEHAGAMGLTLKCVPISVRDVDTGAVTDFPSFIECARAFGLTKDAVSYRVKVGETRIFPERKQYRVKSDKEWYVPSSTQHELLKNGTSKAVSVKDLLTGDVTHYDQMTQVAKQYGFSLPMLSQWLNRSDQSILPQLIQLKWKHDQTPWRKVEDPYLELATFTKHKPVKVLNDNTGEVKLYVSSVLCAKDRKMSPTALHYRLQSNGQKVFPDGFRYGYYPF